MTRIATALKTSEIAEVRRATLAVEESHIAVASIPHRLCAIKLVDWTHGTPDTKLDDYVRLGATVDGGRMKSVIPTIVADAHTGMVEKITLLPAEIGRMPANLILEFVA